MINIHLLVPLWMSITGPHTGYLTLPSAGLARYSTFRQERRLEGLCLADQRPPPGLQIFGRSGTKLGRPCLRRLSFPTKKARTMPGLLS